MEFQVDKSFMSCGLVFKLARAFSETLRDVCLLEDAPRCVPSAASVFCLCLERPPYSLPSPVTAATGEVLLAASISAGVTLLEVLQAHIPISLTASSYLSACLPHAKSRRCHTDSKD